MKNHGMTQEESESHSLKIVCEAAEPNGLAYAREKLGVAVWKLATGTGSIKARLADAFIELAILQESDLPPQLRIQWKRIRSDLTSGKMQYNTVARDGKLVSVPVGRLYSTLRYMRLNRAKSIAERICRLRENLDSYSENDPEQVA
jgi:hypothetical protein